MASLLVCDPVTPTEDERMALAQILRALVEDHDAQRVYLVGLEGQNIALPESLRMAMRPLVNYLLHNQPVTIVPLAHELTTRQAAEILNVSRPYLIEQLLETGKIPYTKTGTHRRIAIADVMEYKRLRDAGRHERMSRMAQASQEFGLGPE